MNEVQGVCAAAITPRGKNGDIDFGASFELIDFLCKRGVNAIALCHSAGEFPTLSCAERSRLVYLALKRSRVPVLVGVGSATLDGSVALAREARDAGAAGLLLPPPYFLSYDQDDLREFYLQFAGQFGGGVPTYLSQLPSSCTNLQAATALDLMSTGQFAGLEMGANSILRIHGKRESSQWRVVGTDDGSFSAARCAGAPFGISSAACAVPELMAALEGAITTQNHSYMQELESKLQEFLAWVNQFPQPVALKAAIELRGMKTGPLAIPLAPGKREKLEQFRHWFQRWLPFTGKMAANG